MKVTGVTLAMHYRFGGLSTYGLNGRNWEMDTPLMLRGVKVKVSICVAHLAYNASNALFVTNPSHQPHGHHVQPADTG